MGVFILLTMLFPIIGAFIVYAFKDNNKLIKNIVLIALLSLTFIFAIINCFVSDLHIKLLSVTEILTIEFRVDNLSILFSVLI